MFPCGKRFLYSSGSSELGHMCLVATDVFVHAFLSRLCRVYVDIYIIVIYGQYNSMQRAYVNY